MNKNQPALMMSAIVVLLFACAGFGYSSMTNRARAVKAESELAALMKVVDANLATRASGTTERIRTARPTSSANFSLPTVQNPEPEADGRNDNPNRNRGVNFMENLKESEPERYAAIVEQRNNFTKQMHDNSTKQVDFFKKLDTKSMTPEQLENHYKLLPMVAKSNQLLVKEFQREDYFSCFFAYIL